MKLSSCILLCKRLLHRTGEVWPGTENWASLTWVIRVTVPTLNIVTLTHHYHKTYFKQRVLFSFWKNVEKISLQEGKKKHLNIFIHALACKAKFAILNLLKLKCCSDILWKLFDLWSWSAELCSLGFNHKMWSNGFKTSFAADFVQPRLIVLCWCCEQHLLMLRCKIWDTRLMLRFAPLV